MYIYIPIYNPGGGFHGWSEISPTNQPVDPHCHGENHGVRGISPTHQPSDPPLTTVGRSSGWNRCQTHEQRSCDLNVS